MPVVTVAAASAGDAVGKGRRGIGQTTGVHSAAPETVAVVVYHVTIVEIVQGLLKKFWPLVIIGCVHCRELKNSKL